MNFILFMIILLCKFVNYNLFTVKKQIKLYKLLLLYCFLKNSIFRNDIFRYNDKVKSIILLPSEHLEKERCIWVVYLV